MMPFTPDMADLTPLDITVIDILPRHPHPHPHTHPSYRDLPSINWSCWQPADKPLSPRRWPLTSDNCEKGSPLASARRRAVSQRHLGRHCSQRLSGLGVGAVVGSALYQEPGLQQTPEVTTTTQVSHTQVHTQTPEWPHTGGYLQWGWNARGGQPLDGRSGLGAELFQFHHYLVWAPLVTHTEDWHAVCVQCHACHTQHQDLSPPTGRERIGGQRIRNDHRGRAGWTRTPLMRQKWGVKRG